MPIVHEIASYTIIAMWAVWVAYWVMCMFGNKRTAYRQPWSQRLAFLVIGMSGFVAMQFVQDPFAQFLHVKLAMDVVGTALCAMGLGWSVWARVVLGTNWSGIVTLKENHELIQRGPYGITRHPIYTGLIVAIFGTVMVTAPSPIGVITLVMIAGAFVVKLKQEEGLMLRHFPEAYPAYKARVKAAIVPWVW